MTQAPLRRVTFVRRAGETWPSLDLSSPRLQDLSLSPASKSKHVTRENMNHGRGWDEPF